MSSSGDALASFAGPAGVGALCLLGAFLFLDGRAPGLFPTFEQYAKTSSWSVIAAIPVLAVSFVLGLSLMVASERVLTNLWGPPLSSQAADLAQLEVSVKESPAAQAYVESVRNRAVLAGGSVALLILAIGALSEMGNLPHLRGVIATAALATVVVAVAAGYLAIREGHKAHEIALAVAAGPTKPPK
jgi:hypothetical protein